MNDDPLLAIVEARLSKLEAAATAAAENAGTIVHIGVIDERGDEARGLAEFDRRIASMRASGLMRPGEVATGYVVVAPPPRDPAQDDREAYRLDRRLAEIERAAAAEQAPQGEARPSAPGMFDFSRGEEAAIAELQRRTDGLPYAQAEPLIRGWERQQQAHIWTSTPGSATARRPDRKDFHRASYQDEFAAAHGPGSIA